MGFSNMIKVTCCSKCQFIFYLLFLCAGIPFLRKITLLFYGKKHTILRQYDQYRRPWGSLVGLPPQRKLQAS